MGPKQTRKALSCSHPEPEWWWMSSWSVGHLNTLGHDCMLQEAFFRLHMIHGHAFGAHDTCHLQKDHRFYNSGFSPTAECYGVSAQDRFRCVLGELGRFLEKNGFREPVPGTGSGNQFWEPDPGFDGFWQVLRFHGSGSEGCVKEVSKVSVYDGFRGVRFCSRGFDGTVSGNRAPGTWGIKKVPGQGFRQLLCTSKVYSCTLKVYFCTLKVCFCLLKVYLLCFASILFYVESMLLCFERIILYLESMLLYVESISL